MSNSITVLYSMVIRYLSGTDIYCNLPTKPIYVRLYHLNLTSSNKFSCNPDIQCIIIQTNFINEFSTLAMDLWYSKEVKVCLIGDIGVQPLEFTELWQIVHINNRKIMYDNFEYSDDNDTTHKTSN